MSTVGSFGNVTEKWDGIYNNNLAIKSVNKSIGYEDQVKRIGNKGILIKLHSCILIKDPSGIQTIVQSSPSSVQHI